MLPPSKGVAFLLLTVTESIAVNFIFVYQVNMRNVTLRDLRNNSIRKRFSHHRKRNVQWTVVAVIELVAIEFYLSPCTVTKILKEMDVKVPSVNTIAKYTQQQVLY